VHSLNIMNKLFINGDSNVVVDSLMSSIKSWLSYRFFYLTAGP
jgi:hypothetical protein